MTLTLDPAPVDLQKQHASALYLATQLSLQGYMRTRQIDPLPFGSWVRSQRILFTGAHGTGKSTLVTTLGSLLNLSVVEEQARIVLEENGLNGGNLYYEPTPVKVALQRAIMTRTSDLLAFFHGKDTGFAADRAYPDNYAYSLALLENAQGQAAVRQLLEDMQHLSRVGSTAFNYVFLVPPNIPMENDGMRGGNPWNRQFYHTLVMGVLEEDGYDYHLLRASDRWGRVEEILDVLTRGYLVGRALAGASSSQETIR